MLRLPISGEIVCHLHCTAWTESMIASNNTPYLRIDLVLSFLDDPPCDF